MPLYALQTFYKGWFWGLGEQLCTVIGAFDYINSFAEWMSIGKASFYFKLSPLDENHLKHKLTLYFYCPKWCPHTACLLDFK